MTKKETVKLSRQDPSEPGNSPGKSEILKPESRNEENEKQKHNSSGGARNGKDIVEKMIISENDVFADILNVLILSQEDQLDPDNPGLVNEIPRSAWFAKGIHERERDILKSMEKNDRNLITIGIENYTDKDPFAGVQIFIYDGLTYNQQLSKVKDNKNPANTIHPVLTFALYYGTNASYDGVYDMTDELDLELLPASLKEEFLKLGSFKYRVINVPNLSREHVDSFKSDFWVIADYFYQIKNYGSYTPTKRKFRHKDKVLYTLRTLLKDDRFDLPEEDRKDVDNMCEVLDIVENRGISKGINIGLAQGIDQGKETLFSNLQKARNYLKSQNRNSEIEQLIVDPKFLESVLEEMKHSA